MSLLRDNIGIPRSAMPQLAGIPAVGSRAYTLPRTPMGGVDLGPEFWTYLYGRGYTLNHGWVPAAHLRATQANLDYSKICTLVALIEKGELPSTCIYTSSDRHIVDGHHRWAAEVVWALRHRVLSRHKVLTSSVNLPIPGVIELAFTFLKEWGPIT